MSQKKLTMDLLKQIISEEKKKLKKQGVLSSETVEDSWSGGDNLVNQIDFIKKLNIKESKLRRKAEIISRARQLLRRKIIKSIDR